MLVKDLIAVLQHANPKAVVIPVNEVGEHLDILSVYGDNVLHTLREEVDMSTRKVYIDVG